MATCYSILAKSHSPSRRIKHLPARTLTYPFLFVSRLGYFSAHKAVVHTSGSHPPSSASTSSPQSLLEGHHTPTLITASGCGAGSARETGQSEGSGASALKAVLSSWWGETQETPCSAPTVAAYH